MLAMFSTLALAGALSSSTSGLAFRGSLQGQEMSTPGHSPGDTIGGWNGDGNCRPPRQIYI